MPATKSDHQSPAPDLHVAEKGEANAKHQGRYEGDQAMADLPVNNLWIVMPALGLMVFISALDNTILATALPTITAQFKASPSDYSWVGTSYLLAQCIMTPINGRVSDIVARRPMLFAAIGSFLAFSALCGGAKNITWLIVARAFAGLGGGSVVSLSTIVLSDIVPLTKRGTYQGYMNAVGGVASAAGPILGGVLSEKASWRWCFYINLPTGIISLALLYFFLKLNPTAKYSFKELQTTFDWPGLLIIMAATTLVIVGFANAADYGFGTPKAYAVFTAGIVVYVGFGFHIFTTKRVAIIPPRMLRIRTTLFLLYGTFCQSINLFAITYLLPEFFQGVEGVSQISSVCAAGGSILTGVINSRLHIIRPTIWFGYGLVALSYGLFYRYLHVGVNYAIEVILFCLAGAGIGISISPPILVIQAAMPFKDMAAATSAWVLTRSIAATVGFAVYQGIFNAGLLSRFSKIPGFHTQFDIPTGSAGYRTLHNLSDPNQRNVVLTAFADAMSACWILGCAVMLSALVLTLFTRKYSLTDRVNHQAESAAALKDAPQGDSEKVDEPNTEAMAAVPAPVDRIELDRHLSRQLSGPGK